MKKLSLIVLFLILSTTTHISAKIVYIDINKILNDSDVGKKTINELEAELKKKNEKFNKIEEELKKEEDGIISKKNIISEEDFKKKIINLRNKVNNYRKERSSNINNFNEKKQSLTNKFISIINPIIADYASKNDISIVIRKEHMIVGKTELDISDDILKLINKDIKEIK
tara:strand:+ start:52 stop:561 length:510 start_codon:yes stop_codon:yes gene_type:complete